VGVGDGDAILDVETADLIEVTRGSSGVGKELGNDGNLLGGIDGLARAVEVLDSHAVRVKVASVLVANTSSTVIAITALITRATVWPISSAGVGSIGGGDGVGFPDIQLVTAGTIFTATGVDISRVW